MTRTQHLRARLLLIDKQITDVLDELRNYGYNLDHNNFNKIYNKQRNSENNEKIREITEKIVSGWEEDENESEIS